MTSEMIDQNMLYEAATAFIDRERVVINAPMDRYTSFRAGGCADVLVTVETVEELKSILNLLAKKDVKHILIGNGSNILIRDGGYRGVIIKQGERFNDIIVDGQMITAFAGARLSAVARTAMEHELTGMEFASGIPGSIGGGVFMNAGAYGGEIKDILVSVNVLSGDGSKEYEIKAEDLGLSYRHSILQSTGDIVISAKIKLQTGEKSKIAAKMKELMEQRNTKQPVQLPSAGSFFKRPEGYFAGQLIQEAGLKGLSVGDAQVSPLHAGFIVNNGKATATEIVALMKLVQNTVFDKYGIMLEPEVRILGEQ